MRIPGAAALIVIGLVVLWLATTGQLDRLGVAWDWVKSGSTDPKSLMGKDVTAPLKNIDNQSGASGVLDPQRYHVAALMQALDPVTNDIPGGIF